MHTTISGGVKKVRGIYWMMRVLSLFFDPAKCPEYFEIILIIKKGPAGKKL
jgi:hypothetical protein